jgi:hypothetical protein
MKKTSFLNGFNAKLALAVMAFTGSLLTGCYKDDGLGVVVPPVQDAQYVVSGSIYLVGATTTAPAAADYTITATQGGKSFTATKATGTFTIAGLSSGIVEITASATGYKSSTKSIEIAPLKAGQAAVYPVTFLLAPDIELEDVKYELTVKAVDIDNIAAGDIGATITVYKQSDMSKLDDISNLPAGGYAVRAEATGYTPTIQMLTLPAKQVVKGSPAEKYATTVLLSKNPIQITVTGTLKIGGQQITAQIVRMKNKLTGEYYKGEGNTNTSHFTFYVPEGDFEAAAATRADAPKLNATLEIIDENSKTVTLDVEFAKPEAGESGDTNSQVDVAINFVAKVGVIEGTPVMGADLTETFTPAIVNATDAAKSYKYTLPIKKGFIVKGTPKTIADNDIDAGSALGKAIDKAMTDARKEAIPPHDDPDYTNDTQELLFNLDANTALISITSRQAFIPVQLKVIGVDCTTTTTVDGEETKKETVGTTDVDVYDWYEQAGLAEMDTPATRGIDHGHDHDNSHGHGHGEGGNAGGGVIEPE